VVAYVSVSVAALLSIPVQLAQSDPRAERGARRMERMEERKNAEENPVLHLEVLNLDVSLPASEGWSVRKDQGGVDLLSRPIPKLDPDSVDTELEIKVRNQSSPDCADWQTGYEEMIREGGPDVERMKVVAAGDWLPEGWHRQVVDLGGQIVTVCRPVLGSVLAVSINKINRLGADMATVTHALAAIDGQVDRLNASIAARPVRLEVLGVSFQGPEGSLWTSGRFPDGGDLVFRTVPAQPEMRMVLGINSSPGVKCAAMIEAAAAQGQKALEEGAQWVPSSWYPKVVRDPKGGVMGCTDTGRGVLIVLFASGGQPAAADFASSRAVLQSVTAALATKP
jgi:hypothetical protein